MAAMLCFNHPHPPITRFSTPTVDHQSIPYRLCKTDWMFPVRNYGMQIVCVPETNFVMDQCETAPSNGLDYNYFLGCKVPIKSFMRTRARFMPEHSLHISITKNNNEGILFSMVYKRPTISINEPNGSFGGLKQRPFGAWGSAFPPIQYP